MSYALRDGVKIVLPKKLSGNGGYPPPLNGQSVKLRTKNDVFVLKKGPKPPYNRPMTKKG